MSKTKTAIRLGASISTTKGVNIHERQTPNPTWDSQHNEAGGDPTARDVGQSQIVLPDSNVAGNYSIKPYDLMPQTIVRFERVFNDAQTEPGSEMAASKTDLAKSSELLAVNLWDEAYGDLKSQEPDQIKMYEETVIIWLEANSMLRKPLIDIPLEDGNQPCVIPDSMVQFHPQAS